MDSPDFCNNLTTFCTPPQEYCSKCSHASYNGSAKIGKRTYRWQYNPMFGPLFTWSKSGACNWSGPNKFNHQLWIAFKKWLNKKFNGVK